MEVIQQTRIPYYIGCEFCKDAENRGNFEIAIFDFQNYVRDSEILKEFLKTWHKNFSEKVSWHHKKGDYEDGVEWFGLHYPKASIVIITFHRDSTTFFTWLRLIAMCKLFIWRRKKNWVL